MAESAPSISIPMAFIADRCRWRRKKSIGAFCSCIRVRRGSPESITGKCSRRISTETGTLFRNFDKIVDLARDMHQAFLRHDWEDVARLIREEWKHRRTNVPGITTPKIDKLIEVARKKGGRAAKVCGAGGGGCILLMVEEGAKAVVSQAVSQAGGRMLPLKVAREGLRISPPPRIRTAVYN